VTSSVIAASPLGLHPLQEIAANLDSELPFPPLNDRRDSFVKKLLVPFMYYVSPLCRTAAGPYDQFDPFMVKGHAGLGVPMHNRQKMS
jgi:hypothetical protein